MKIFGIGAHKTGTTTLEEILKILKLKIFNQNEFYYNEDFYSKIIKKDYKILNEKIINYEGFQDSPFNHNNIYKYLYENFDDSLFILTIRNSNNWIKSYEKHLIRLKNDRRFLRSNIYKFSKLFWDDEYPDCIQNFTIINKNKLIDIYEKRNLEIIKFFEDKPNKLLILNICDDDEKTNLEKINKFIKCNTKIEIELKIIPKLNSF